MSEKYEKQVYLAMLAEQCGRFEDMTEFLEQMINTKTSDLTSDERNLLSIAYKNSISQRRTAIRTLHAYENKEAKKEHSLYLEHIKEYKAKVEKELTTLALKIIKNIDTGLLSKTSDPEAKVFYHKMKGDYYRYIAENVEGKLKEEHSQNSLKSYEDATNSSNELDIANPIRLGLALNFSVFYFEVLNNQEKACQIAKETLDLAKKKLSGVDEDDEEYKDAFSIINLLQENLNMWTMESEA